LDDREEQERTLNPKSFTWLAAAALSLAAIVPSLGHANAQQPAKTLVDVVRQSTERYHDVGEATAAGYAPMLGCVSGPQAGAMGVHYMNPDLIGDGKLDASKPEALLYEMRDGEMHFLGVEFLVLAESWDGNQQGPPALMGQLFNYIASPNRYGNPPFYELHVWVGQDNPNGTFADFNPTVSCDAYSDEAMS
jgi:hypothetical protein